MIVIWVQLFHLTSSYSYRTTTNVVLLVARITASFKIIEINNTQIRILKKMSRKLKSFILFICNKLVYKTRRDIYSHKIKFYNLEYVWQLCIRFSCKRFLMYFLIRHYMLFKWRVPHTPKQHINNKCLDIFQFFSVFFPDSRSTYFCAYKII